MLFVFQERWNKWLDALKLDRRQQLNCVVKDDHFYFPRGYYYKYGFLKTRKDLPFRDVQEVRVNTFPISAIVNGNEVIFLRGLERDEVKGLAKRGLIKLTDPADIWSLICEEFLDTDASEAEKRGLMSMLLENGFEEGEIQQIRKRLRSRMLIRTYFSWEWEYYGHEDVMAELWPLSKRKYEWTMEVALRNARRSSHHS